MTKNSDHITIAEVAQRAGVSIATVSRVINESVNVADRTRARVHDAIDELHFKPNRTARALARQRLESLVVALPTFTTPFQTELLKGVREAITGSDLELLIWDLGWRNVGAALSRFLSRGSVSGLLLVGMLLDERALREIANLRTPVVLIGTQSEAYDSFYWDDVAGARLAVSHLAEQGHRLIGMIASSTRNDVQSRRIQGYRDALDRAGIEFDEALVVAGRTEKHAGFSEEAGYEAMRTLLQRAPMISAVFASSDVQAIGAMNALEEAGKLVPQDVAVVGYDDLKISRFVGLSSIDQRAQEVGNRAASILISRIEGERSRSVRTEHIIPRLRIRSSSAVVPCRRFCAVGM